MSDFNSSLPVRTENAGDVQVKIVDSTVTSQQLTVNSDGSINTNVSATNLDIRDLAFASDKVDVSGSTVELGSTSLAALESITVQNGAGASAVNIQDGGNSITVDGSVSISGTPTVELGSTTLTALESITVQNGAGASAVNIQDGGNSITVDGSVSISGTPTVELGATSLAALESITVQNGAGASAVNIQDGGNSITVDANNLDIRDLVFATDKVDVSGSTVSATFTETNGIVDYNTAAAVAANATSNHTYTAAANFYFKGVEASATGKMKIEVQVNGVTKFVMFNSASTPSIHLQLPNPLLVTTGQTVVIIRTNKDNQAQDVYSSILGHA